MDKLERIMSRPVAKPYRSKGIQNDAAPYLNKDGLLDFSPNDIENPKNWYGSRENHHRGERVTDIFVAQVKSSQMVYYRGIGVTRRQRHFRIKQSLGLSTKYQRNIPRVERSLWTRHYPLPARICVWTM